MRRLVTVTILGLALAGCSAGGEPPTPGGVTPAISASSLESRVTAVTSVNVAERQAALTELCNRHCDELMSAIKLEPCTEQKMCDLMSLRLSESLHDYSTDLQSMPDRLNFTESDTSWISEITDALSVAEQLLTGNDCTGMTKENAFSFGRCSQLTGTLREKSFSVGAKLQELAGG